jgi:hypothetical protein
MVNKLPIFGTPITPAHLLQELVGESFCVSFWTKRDAEVARIRGLVGEMLMLDNGAYSAWQKGGDEPFLSAAYLDDYEAWAGEQLELCPAAVAVVADTITGTTEQNRALWKASRLPKGRRMVVFHMHESDEYLRELLASGESHLAFGSSGQFAKVGTPEWHARIAGMMAVVDEAETRPHVHMMRAQAQHSLYAWDSSDSTNLAVNHCRYKHQGAGYVRRFADRIHEKVAA